MTTNETENNAVEVPVSEQPTEDTFQFDDSFEERLLAFLVRDYAFFQRNNLVKEIYFQNQIRRDIYRLARNYSEKYSQPPTIDVLKNEIQRFFYEKKKKDTDIEYFEVAGDLYKVDLTTAEKYTEDITLSFAQNREMKKVILESAKLVGSKKDLSPILEKVTKVLEMKKKVTPEIRTCDDVDETQGSEEEDWVARGLIAKNDINIWYAPPGIGKSHLQWVVGNAINDGKECLGIDITQSPVTYLDLENTEDVRRHIKRLFGGGKMRLITLRKEDAEIPNIDSEPEEFEKFILTLPKGAVFIDTFPMITEQTKFAESKWEVGPMFKTLRRLCEKYGYTFVLIFHSLKGDPTTIKAPQEVLGRAGHVLQIFEVSEVGVTKEKEESDIINPNKPKTLFVGTQASIKTRHKKYAYWLQADFNEESEEKGFKRINPNVSSLLQVRELCVEYILKKEGDRGEPEISDCPGRTEFIGLIRTSEIVKSKAQASRLLELAITEKYLAKDKVLRGKSWTEYIYPLPLKEETGDFGLDSES